jgi:hypothetical protein
MAHAERLRKIKFFLRNVFAVERLDEAPIAANHRDRKRQFAAMLFRQEPLALEPVPPPQRSRPGLLRALFARETLAEDPPPPPKAPAARSGSFPMLFAREALPELSPAPVKPERAAWLRWLFRFERLDPP